GGYRASRLARQGLVRLAPAEVRPVLRVEIESILDSAHGVVPHDVARELLGAYGLRFCRESIAHSEERELQAATALGFPVVLKTARPDVLHKTEAGGVIVGLRSEADLRDV